MDDGDTRRHQRIRPRWCRREHATTGADQALGPRPVTLSSEGGPLLAVSGSSWERAEVSSQGLWVVACHCVGTEGSGSLLHLSPLVPGPHGGRGHACRTPPRACSVGNAILTIRKVPGWHVDCVPSATEVAVRAGVGCSPTLGGRRAATTP